MKAISLWQPWASAIALGLKTIEKRGHLTHYRGPLAIHAAQKKSGDLKDAFAYEFLFDFRAVGVSSFVELPLGAIVAVCDLVDCVPTEEFVEWEEGKPGRVITGLERQFGNYEVGRFAWVLANVRKLETPVPFKGRQGFFNVEDSLL